jgi:hypothetical protein
MARQRAKKPAAMKIDELPRPQEELTPDQAEAVQGGIVMPPVMPTIEGPNYQVIAPIDTPTSMLDQSKGSITK